MSTLNIDDVEFTKNGFEKAEEKRVYFRCPMCGHDLLLNIVKTTYPLHGVVSVERWKENNRRFWFPLAFERDDDNPEEEHYRCGGCGYTLMDENETEIDNCYKLTDWLMANCPQENQETDEQKTE